MSKTLQTKSIDLAKLEESFRLKKILIHIFLGMAE